ncbi:MAG: L-lysine 6-transaminase [Candidatus Delongbacteria bacterium]|nr:L-lysine 6-transaminase [Candidatus Delongbacteria bacterium]
MTAVTPAQVHETIGRHMLADGMDLVFDLRRSKGRKIYDSRRERWLLDFFSFFASAPIGFNHPALLEPEFMSKLSEVAVNNITNSDLYTEEMAAFVDRFSSFGIPDYLPHLFMVAGGGLAVENALKVAFDWKRRKNIAHGKGDSLGSQVIHFRQAFHGRTGYTLSLTNTSDPRKTIYFPKFDWPRIDNPKVTFPLNQEHLAAVQQAEELAVKQIHAAIAANPDDIAALIIEPIQGEGGDNHFRNEFFQQLRTICDEQELFLILDEVQTGVGLTGRFWAHEHTGMQPDAIAFGKKSQVCGILVSRRVEEVEGHVFVESSRINSTWGGNLIDMVRFGKYLDVIEQENLVANAATQGDYLLQQLEQLQIEFPQLSNARGRGLMCAFDLPSGTERDNFVSALYEAGLVILGCGDNSVRFRPSLNITRDELDEGLALIRGTLLK